MNLHPGTQFKNESRSLGKITGIADNGDICLIYDGCATGLQITRPAVESAFKSGEWTFELDTFTEHYLITALWATTDNADESGWAPLDDNFGVEDIAPEALAETIQDCIDFQTANAADLAEYCERINTTDGNPAIAWAGHDFLLTRSGHGCGFWDRGLGDLGKRLSEAAKVYGNVDFYPGDDGKIYV